MSIRLKRCCAARCCGGDAHDSALPSALSGLDMGTVIAFDFGLKRIGVAVGNSLLKQATPLAVIEAATNDAKFAAIGEVLSQWQPDLLVVGLPLHPDGAEHAMTARCRRFANQLHGRYGIPAVLVDERYTSAVLSQQRGQHVDSDAAGLILQQYFDQHEPS